MTGGTRLSDLFRDTLRLAKGQVEGMVWLCVAGLVVPILTLCSLGVLTGPLFYGYARMGMRIARGEPTSLRDLFEGVRTRFVATTLAFVICTGIGVVALGFLLVPAILLSSSFDGPESALTSAALFAVWTIFALAMSVPGMVFGFLAQFTFHVMASHPALSPLSALRGSMLLVRDHVEEIAVAIIACLALALIASTFVVFVGGFVAGAFCVVLQSLLYDRLTGPEGSGSEQTGRSDALRSGSASSAL
ncbi:MAG: hypothetical protein HYV07_04235 [Deltaproteobacteria bacterium]|nr:hypothetical protein [Deltaproteobacteria bacterium]